MSGVENAARRHDGTRSSNPAPSSGLLEQRGRFTNRFQAQKSPPLGSAVHLMMKKACSPTRAQRYERLNPLGHRYR
jgi:hypothetical protein